MGTILPLIRCELPFSLFDGRSEEALDAITAALKNDPWTPHLQLGIAHYYLADHEAAKKALTAALERNPVSRPTLLSLIASCGRLGKTGDAQWMAAEYEALGQHKP